MTGIHSDSQRRYPDGHVRRQAAATTRECAAMILLATHRRIRNGQSQSVADVRFHSRPVPIWIALQNEERPVTRYALRLLATVCGLILVCCAYALSADEPRLENAKVDELSGEVIVIESKGGSSVAVEHPRT